MHLIDASGRHRKSRISLRKHAIHAEISRHFFKVSGTMPRWECFHDEIHHHLPNIDNRADTFLWIKFKLTVSSTEKTLRKMVSVTLHHNWKHLVFALQYSSTIFYWMPTCGIYMLDLLPFAGAHSLHMNVNYTRVNEALEFAFEANRLNLHVKQQCLRVMQQQSHYILHHHVTSHVLQ